tara:strand:+ start:400 stop:849 length:450 start_codon:yes stop_codon:yes gene_type:complete
MAVTNLGYNTVVEYIGDNTIDLDGTAGITAALFVNTFTFTATNSALADVVPATHEVSGSGYVRDILTQTWVNAAGTVTFDTGDATFSATGGSITASDMVVFDDAVTTPVVDALMFSIDFGADEVAGDGTDFIVAPHATQGWFQASYVNA